MKGLVDRWKGWWIDGWMDTWMDGWIGGGRDDIDKKMVEDYGQMDEEMQNNWKTERMDGQTAVFKQ